VKVYHNDARIDPFLEDLADAGFEVLNWTHNLEICEARRRTKGRICLMVNVPPLEMGCRGSTAQVRMAALEILRKAGREGIILSMGGGVSPGTPKANILAMTQAVEEVRSSS
jgi:uroporphyrinogen decarboxylase